MPRGSAFLVGSPVLGLLGRPGSPAYVIPGAWGIRRVRASTIVRMPQIAPYGSWESPVTTALMTDDAATITDVRSQSGIVWWSEMRPSEGGRIQVVRREPDGLAADILPDGFSARTRVHEYGGGAWWPHEDVVFFANWTDQRVYRISPGAAPEPITPEPEVGGAWRYADGIVTSDGRWIICVREDHTEKGEPRNELVGLATDGSCDPVVLVAGHDFVSSPRMSADQRQVAWIAWDHPNMPWDDTELWLGQLELTGEVPTIERARRVAGGPGKSVMQPRWNRHGILHMISDRSNLWNVYRVDGVDAVAPLLDVNAEIGGPPWLFGRSDYAFTSPDGDLVATWSADGIAHVSHVSRDGEVHTSWPLPYAAMSFVHADGEAIVAAASSADREPEVVRFVLTSEGPDVEVLRPARELGLDPAGISRAEAITFPSRDGREAHAFVYRPASAEFTGPDGDLPPLIVMSHGGPTAAASSAFQLGIQFWTSRGFAVIDVNYGGSTGFGRAYRKSLEGAWGIIDVEDCCSAAEYLAEQGLVDPQRLAIRGGSAGGFTTLSALALTDTFQAGANHFGVSDMETLATLTHKFESRYLDSMVGPYPEAKSTYEARSPINHVAGFSAPLITFQGLDDKVVLPEQSERIVQALDAAGIPHAYLAFEGEQHGFRRAETIAAVHDAELSFYAQVFGFEPAGVETPVTIVHAEALGDTVPSSSHTP